MANNTQKVVSVQAGPITFNLVYLEGAPNEIGSLDVVASASGDVLVSVIAHNTDVGLDFDNFLDTVAECDYTIPE